MKTSEMKKGQPTMSDVHVDVPLTNISIAYPQKTDAFVADSVFPNIPVSFQSDKYWTYDRGMFNRSSMALRAENTESQGIDYTVTTATYSCDVWALHVHVSDQRRANSSSPLQPDREATELLMQQAMIKREQLWAANFFAASKWTNDPTPSTLWDAASGSDPLADIETGMQTVGQSTGFEPNKCVMNRQVWGTIKNHADIIDRIKYGQTSPGAAQVSKEAFGQLIEIDDVLVSKAIRNTAAQGATNSHSYIAGKHCLLVYAAPNPGIMTPSGGYTFSWSGYAGAGPAGQRVSRYRMDNLRADRIELEMAFDQKLVSADLGYLLESVIS
jgi:hypothetical protein